MPGVTDVGTEDRQDGEEAAGEADFFGMSLDHLCVAGLNGYFERVNPSWTRTLGWSREELLALPSIELVHPDDREATLDDPGLHDRRRLRAVGVLLEVQAGHPRVGLRVRRDRDAQAGLQVDRLTRGWHEERAQGDLTHSNHDGEDSVAKRHMTIAGFAS